ncbi:ribosome maturation factor RimM [Muribaculum sp.]|uniref:ribosome maturation factor RimM n=1 Tax=Muribaculum sp. TaxID=1918611 RepID=UPI0023CED869|nr:ribosome maturation factor RimM [Muribaculum sp.]MDE5705190.1 ribosome maturation factor RimM [Muribaculum sp.]
MITLDRLTPIGRLGKPHGINGEINAYLDVDIDIESLKRIILLIDGIYVPFFIASMRQKRSDTYIMALDDINNEREAAELTNHPLYVLTSDNIIIEDDTDGDDRGLYASDLIGFKVIDDDTQQTVGEITDIDDSTENVLFIISTPSSATVYLPVADEFITEIDTDSHILRMSLPEGILDL